jgi:peptidyl-prolyl cis-trans isomerase B (cyclophilin B)
MRPAAWDCYDDCTVKKLISLFLLASTAAAAPPAPTRHQKMIAILSAEHRRDAAALADLVRDGDPGVRRRATLAAGRVGDRSLTPPLLDRLADPLPEVRQVAALALGLIGDAAGTDRLTAALKDSDSVVRARAAEALGRIGDARTAGAVAQMVLQAVPKGVAPLAIRGDDPGSAADPWLELRLGLFALAALKDTPSAVSVLLESGRVRFDWWAAAWTAAALGGPEMEPVLLASAASSDPLARAIAAGALGRYNDAPAREVLAKLVRDREDAVAARALGTLGATGDPKAVTIAVAALREASPARKVAALEAHAALLPPAHAGDDLVALVGHDEPAVRAAALRALARVDREELALVLSGMDPDPFWSVRAAIAEGLAGSKDELSLGLLYGLLKDPDGRLAAAALDALKTSQGALAASVLVQSLAHPDLAMRETAARGLAAIGAGPYSRELAEAYRASRRDPDPEARLAIVSALAPLTDEIAKAALRSAAAEDPLRVVRVAAARALAAAGETPPAAPDEPAAPLLDYARAMAPYDPRPDQALFTPRAFLHTRRGVVEIHLNTLEAPIAARTFIGLARRGFFDGLEFHEVAPGMRVESGCPRGDGRGGPGFRIPREAGLKPFGRGAVGLDAPAKDGEGSRFFITLTPDPSRDGRATLLGTVVKGLEVVERLRPHDTIERVEIWD